MTGQLFKHWFCGGKTRRIQYGNNAEFENKTKWLVFRQTILYSEFSIPKSINVTNFKLNNVKKPCSFHENHSCMNNSISVFFDPPKKDCKLFDGQKVWRRKKLKCECKMPTSVELIYVHQQLTRLKFTLNHPSASTHRYTFNVAVERCKWLTELCCCQQFLCVCASVCMRWAVCLCIGVKRFVFFHFAAKFEYIFPWNLSWTSARPIRRSLSPIPSTYKYAKV